MNEKSISIIKCRMAKLFAHIHLETLIKIYKSQVYNSVLLMNVIIFSVIKFSFGTYKRKLFWTIYPSKAYTTQTHI